MNAAANPCNARPSTSAAGLGATPHASDAAARNGDSCHEHPSLAEQAAAASAEQQEPSKRDVIADTTDCNPPVEKPSRLHLRQRDVYDGHVDRLDESRDADVSSANTCTSPSGTRNLVKPLRPRSSLSLRANAQERLADR